MSGKTLTGVYFKSDYFLEEEKIKNKSDRAEKFSITLDRTSVPLWRMDGFPFPWSNGLGWSNINPSVWQIIWLNQTHLIAMPWSALNELIPHVTFYHKSDWAINMSAAISKTNIT